MIEKIITSKTRVKLLELFLTNIDARYYLRELERKLDESLSPLRRQLLKLEKMGILKAEYEANLKYYRLNKEFVGMEELRRLVLGNAGEDRGTYAPNHSLRSGTGHAEASAPVEDAEPMRKEVIASPSPKRVKYDIAVLSVMSFFVLAVAVFMLYTGTKSAKQVASFVSEKAEAGPRLFEKSRGPASALNEATRPDEMVSRRWKVFPGNVPVLSSGETGGGKRSEEL